MTDNLKGSALRKMQRVIEAQGYDARHFEGGRILRLLVSRRSGTKSIFKQLFIANLTGLSLDDAIAATKMTDAIVISHDEFRAVDQFGPAVISERRLHPIEGTASDLVARSQSPRLLTKIEDRKSSVAFPGPFSAIQQEIASGLREGLGLGLYGARAMWAESSTVVKEECYSLLATDRGSAASSAAEFASSRRGGAADPTTIEIEDTLFDRPYYGNPLLIIEHRSSLELADFLIEQALPVLRGSAGS